MKLDELFELLISFSGKADDEAGADDNTRHFFSQFSNGVDDILTRCGAPHRFQHLIVDMLDGHVKIRTDALIAFDQGNQFISDFIGIEIEEAQPEGLVDGQHAFSRSTSAVRFFEPLSLP